MTEVAWERRAPAAGEGPDASAPPAESRTTRPTGWRAADALLAICLLTTLMVVGNLGRMPQGLEEFLAVRLTLKSLLLLGAFALVWPQVLSRCGLYAPARLRSGEGEWPRLLVAGAIGACLALVFPLTSQSGAARPEHALLFGVTFAPAAIILRGTARAAQRANRAARRPQVVIVGSGPLAKRMYCTLELDPLRTDEVIGFVDSDPQQALRTSCAACALLRRSRCRLAASTSAGPAHLGGVPQLEQILMRRVVDGVIVCLPIKSRYDEIQQALAACARVGVPAKYPADLFRRGLGVAFADDGTAAPVFYVAVAPNDYRLLIKRATDVVGAAALLVLVAPLMLAAALLVKLTSRGPVFFAQERYGYMKRRFQMLKFRTMVDGADRMQADLEHRNEATGPVFKIRDDPRVTRIGRFLRRSSLDELPQLWHVLTGEMSLVGPRPMAVRDVSRFPEPWLMRRFSVKPGLTCLWQISGRSGVGFDSWIALDLEYIDRWSVWLDLKILLRTMPAVVRGTGAM